MPSANVKGNTDPNDTFDQRIKLAKVLLVK